MTATAEQSLTQIIRDHLEGCNGSIDTEAIARELISELDPEMREEVLVSSLRHKVSGVVAGLRPPATDAKSKPARSGRWDNVSDNRDVLDDWYVSFTDRPSKALMDCSPQDLDEAAEWYELRAEGYKARAESYRALAIRVRKARKGSPADLNRDEVRRILNA